MDLCSNLRRYGRAPAWSAASVVLCALALPAAAQDRPFVRGDVDQNGSVNLTDVIRTLGYLFLGGPPAECLDSADSNDDGSLDLSDGLFALNLLFLGGPQFPEPYPGCGLDPTVDQLDCRRFASCATTAALVAAQSLSEHYVLVTYDEPVEDLHLEAGLYRIWTLEGAALGVLDVRRNLDDPATVILATDAQETVPYALTVANGGEPPGDTWVAGIGPAGSIVFQGSDDAEPRVVSAVSLGSTEEDGRVLLTFSEPIEEGALDIRFYSISAPDLEVRAAQFSVVGQGGTTIELTTDSQRSLLYTVKVTNVKSRAGDFLVDPTRNEVSFYGIPPVDTVPPLLLSAVPTSNTEVVLSFSEPLWPGADDPRNFVITCFDPFTQSACPGLVVAAAELTMLDTQIVLTTLPQGPGLEYTVTIVDRCGSPPERDNCVQDLQENAIDPEGNTALFLGLDRAPPTLSSAISLGPDPSAPEDRARVLLRFSEPVLAGADEAGSYTIDSPDLDIIAAELSLDGLTVVLTTEDQANVEYVVRVAGVRSRASGYFIDPDRSTAAFFGIPPVDAVPPPPRERRAHEQHGGGALLQRASSARWG